MDERFGLGELEKFETVGEGGEAIGDEPGRKSGRCAPCSPFDLERSARRSFCERDEWRSSDDGGLVVIVGDVICGVSGYRCSRSRAAEDSSDGLVPADSCRGALTNCGETAEKCSVFMGGLRVADCWI